MGLSSEAVARVAGASAHADAGWVRRAFAGSPDLVALIDAAGVVIESSRDALRAGSPYADFFRSDLRADLRNAIRRAVDTCVAVRLEAAHVHRDGSSHWYLVTLTPMLAGGAATALSAVATDITERRREEQRLRRNEALMVDSQGVAHLGTWEWDVTLPHAVWSSELYRIYGLDPQTHVPTYEDYLTRVHPEDRQRVIDATNGAFHGLQPYSHDERIFRSDGSVRFLHTWATPVLDDAGKLTRLMGVCQDITDRKLAEIALADHAEQLARSNAELEQFARIASHDLQEPLRTVGSFVQLLARRYAGQLDEGANEAISFAIEGVRRMKAQIEGLLEYSRITARSAVPVKVDLNGIIDQVCVNLDATIRESGATIRRGALPPVSAEPTQMASLLQNLIGNAIKFRGAEAPVVEIDARALPGTIELSVRDNGIGIAAEYHERIFVVFQRLDTDTPGTGIGLALCRKIVERHGGRLWVDSAPGRGATFRATLPRAEGV